MRKKLLILIVGVFALLTSILLTNPAKFEPVTVFKPGTIIGNMNLSRTSWEIGKANLSSRLTTPFYINLESKSRGVTPEELGITLDKDKLAKLSSTCKTKLMRIFCRNTSNERINPDDIFVIDEGKLALFLDELNKEMSYLSKNNIISFDNNTFRALSPEATITIDESEFKSAKSLARIITTDNFVVNLEIKSEDSLELQKEATEQLILSISAPLLIKYGRNPIYIPAETVSGFIETLSLDGFFYGKVNKIAIKNYIKEISNQYASDDVVLEEEQAVEAVTRAILFRAANYEINNAVVLPLKGNPKSNGELHNEYLEIVKSQQRLYKFKGGKLVKTYIISTGLTWETPAGEFEILGKQKMTVSYYDDWYMPNYLPIGTINGYFFGFHEIPYHMDAAGNIYSRDANTMGSPATGGCVQLKPGDSLEIFDGTPIGTPVYIYE